MIFFGNTGNVPLILQLKLSTFFLSIRLIPKKLMTGYTGMEECENTNTTTKRKI